MDPQRALESFDVFKALYSLNDSVGFLFGGVTLHQWRMNHLEHSAYRIDTDRFMEILEELKKYGYISEAHSYYVPTELGISRMHAFSPK